MQALVEILVLGNFFSPNSENKKDALSSFEGRLENRAI